MARIHRKIKHEIKYGQLPYILTDSWWNLAIKITNTDMLNTSTSITDTTITKSQHNHHKIIILMAITNINMFYTSNSIPRPWQNYDTTNLLYFKYHPSIPLTKLWHNQLVITNINMLFTSNTIPHPWQNYDTTNLLPILSLRKLCLTFWYVIT